MLCYYSFSRCFKYPLQDIVSNYYILHKYDGNDTLAFTLDSETDDYKRIKAETLVEAAGNRWLVKKINGSKIECSLDFDFLRENFHVNFNSGSKTLSQMLATYLPNDWTVLGGNLSTISRTIKFDYCTDYDIVQQCMSTYDVCFVWSILNKTVTVYKPELAQVTGEYLTDELNLKKVSYKSETTKFVSRLYAYGKDGLSFADINNGKAYVENTSYAGKVVCSYWADNRYTVKANLLEAAQKKVNEISSPVTSYECDVVDLAKQNPEKYSFLDFSMHKIVTLIDRDRGLTVNHHIVQYKEYPDEPDRNVVTLSVVPETIVSTTERVESDLKDLIDQVEFSLDAEITRATDLINYNMQGHVTLRHNELLIMDTEDVATATGVWRWTYGGLGFSPNGYSGPYNLALTNDGHIVADLITVGELDGVVIKAGTVSATALSTEYKNSVTSEISGATTALYQSMIASDGEFRSTIRQYDITPAISTALSDYYTKTETSSLISQSASGIMLQVYTKTETSDLITGAVTTAESYTDSSLLNYYTQSETTAAIEVSSNSIKQIVSSSFNKYDETGVTHPINYRGFGGAASNGYPATGNTGKFYLDQNTGKMYVSDGNTWSYISGGDLPLITTELQTQIAQNSTDIALRVIKGDRTVGGSTVNDVISEINASAKGITLSTAGRLIITAGNFRLDSNGTLTATNAILYGTFQTSTSQTGYYTKIFNGIIETYLTNKRVGYIAPVIGSYTHLGIIADVENYEGITFGTEGRSGTITTYYEICANNAYNTIGCRHHFSGTVKFDDRFKSNIDFDNDLGICWGGDIGIRYATTSAGVSHAGIWVGNGSKNLFFNGSTVAATSDFYVTNKLKFLNFSGWTAKDAIWYDWGNGGLDVGATSYKLWLNGSTIYADGTTIATTSDSRKKNTISDLDSKYLAFIKSVKPVGFKYNDGASGRIHTGFIAQDVLQALTAAGITRRILPGSLI